MAGLMDMLSTADSAHMAQMPAEENDNMPQYAVALTEQGSSGGWKAYGGNFRQKKPGGSGGGSDSKTCSTPFKKCGDNCVDVREDMDFCGTCNKQVCFNILLLDTANTFYLPPTVSKVWHLLWRRLRMPL